jgi:nucleotide-binding universal stress UspA family protein
MFKKVLLSISSEFYPEQAVKEAKFIQDNFSSSVYLLYIIEKKTLDKFEKASQPFLTHEQKMRFEDDILNEQRKIADDIMEKVKNTLNIKESKIVIGEYSDEIEKMVEEKGIDLVIIGFKRDAVIHYRVIERIKIPLLIAIFNGSDGVVGVCSNLAPNVKVPAFVKEFASAVSKEPRLVYIIDREEPAIVDEAGNKIEKSIDEIRKIAEEFVSHHSTISEIREGIMENEIEKVAKDTDAFVIVIGREIKKRKIFSKEIRKKIVENSSHSILFLN